MIIIGIVGQIASGKGVLVDCLVKEHGFVAFSLSSIVHDELAKRRIKDFSRRTLQDIGDELRQKYGRDILARKVIEILERSREIVDSITPYQSLPTNFQFHRFVIEGIRNPAEIEYLKTFPNFTLIAVKSIRELRFQRLKKRHKSWDPKTWPEFLTVDRRDLGIGQKASGQQVGKCLHYADYTITNNGSIGELNKKIRKLVDKLQLLVF